MRKLFLLLVFFVGTTVSLYSQNAVVFKYDDAGNRTSREIPTVTLRSSASEEPADSTNVATDLLQNYIIKVYPNPTFGQLTIEIEDFEVETPLDVVVFDRYGKILQRHVMGEPFINLNLTQYPSSTWYIVAFILNEERRDFKIIKM